MSAENREAGALGDGPAATPPAPLTARPGGPPGAWVDAVVALAIEHSLPRLILDPVDAVQVGGSWQLHPWRMGLDLTALAEWAMYLDRPDDAIVAIYSSGPQTAVIVSGLIAGIPTELVGCTRRPMGPSGLRSTNVLRLTAIDELRAAGVVLPSGPGPDRMRQPDPLDEFGPVTA